mgnify:CR=1 FL=1
MRGMAESSVDSLKLLTVGQVADLLGISVRTCWRLSALAEAGHGSFPRPLRLSAKCVRWRLADLRAYLDHLARDRT